MSKEIHNERKSDEIDIVEIFNLIGRAIKSVFDFIFEIFKQILTLLVLFALFVRRNIIILSVVTIIGFITGSFLDHYQKTYYTSNMVVEPNYGTTTQLIDYIKLYHQLAQSRDSVALGRILDIPASEASQIISISLEVKNSKNTRLKLFDEFVKEADSTTLKNITFEEFGQNLTISDYEQYVISLDALDKTVFNKIQKKIIDIPLTDYIHSLKKTELSNLETQVNNIQRSLNKVDSLRSDYQKIMLYEDTKMNRPTEAGTIFYMGTENIRTTNELQLFDIERNYNKILDELTVEQTKKENFINIVSGFQDIGIRMRTQTKFLYALIAFGLALLFLAFREFNKFLIAQEIKLNGNA